MSRPVQSRQSENADPHEQYNPVPRVVILVVLALLAWAVYYIVSAQPNSSPRLGDQRPLAVLAPAPASASADGKQLYANACVACHQATGQGLPGVFPPLADSEWVKGEPTVLAQLVLHGITGPITVKGQEYQGAMPAFAEQFSDAELAAVLSFIRHEWGNEVDAITPELVAQARTASADRSQPWQGEKELQDWIAAQ
ncbi:MAG TPA: cytochrome C oxidase Cbb3 [Alcaligenes faecalis]|nr:cytochrome c [Alcaligenes faecalis]HBQ91355.1 cytochrome C oxidase Cbb3 [Alcaligenes faecalis]